VLIELTVSDSRCKGRDTASVSDLHCRRARVRRHLTIDIAVLASGSGTNLQALIDTPAIRPHIVLVAGDRVDARALQRARDAGIDTAVVDWDEHSSRDEFSRALADMVEHAGAKGVVLAGFMRILSPSFLDRFPQRVLNIHPSLLPAFPGANAVANALEHRVKLTGVTIHIVDERVDQGPIIAQVPVEVWPDDDVESLHARIQDQEHRLYPEVVTAFVEGRVEVVERKVVLR
jgi:phosphoribosylglycinamide formyltransferase-1